MAEIPWDVKVALDVQTDLGTINGTVQALSGAVDETDGLVLGDPDSGVGESGIEVTFTRDLEEKAKLGNFTPQASDFVKEAIDGLTIAFPMKGSGAAVTPADAEYLPDKGIDALFQSLSLAPAAWGGGFGQIYKPAAIKYLTIKLWIGNTSGGNRLAWVFQDCIASGEIVWEPTSVGVCTVSLEVGSVAQFAEESGLTFDFGNQASVASPVVKNAAHVWDSTRGFQNLTLGISNTIEQIDDSNAATGQRPRVTDREINLSGTLFSDDADLDYERSQLIATSAPTDIQSFRVGDDAQSVSEIATGYQVRVMTPELRSLKPVRVGDSLAWEIESLAVAATANADFELIFD